jgi:hypothetical protein
MPASPSGRRPRRHTYLSEESLKKARQHCAGGLSRAGRPVIYEFQTLRLGL